MSYIDIQVNGAYGVDFNDDQLTLDQFHFATSKLVESGVEAFFPTIITGELDKMCHQIERIALWVEKNSFFKNVVKGLHIEGPFISNKPGFRGTHPESAIREASPEVATQLVHAGRGLVKLMTLAPEQDPDLSTIKKLREIGVIVFGGHSDASYEALTNAIDAGMQGFTHLGNGCAMEVHRHDNILHRILALQTNLHISIIADGIHVPWWLLRSWSNSISSDHLIVTSDSMSAAGMPPGEYLIGNQYIVVDASRRTRHRDHQYLAGSASTMQDMEQLTGQWTDGNRDRLTRYFHRNAAQLFQI